jgi:hypothetical protein
MGGQTPTTKESFTGNLMDAMGMNLPLHCTWTSGEDSGEAYVKGENMYATTTTNGQTGYMSRKDNCSYIWGNQVEQALKICDEVLPTDSIAVDAPDYPTATGGDEESQGPDLSVDYHCNPAVINDDLFNLPSDINFMDMEAMMQEMVQGMPSLPSGN